MFVMMCDNGIRSAPSHIVLGWILVSHSTRLNSELRVSSPINLVLSFFGADQWLSWADYWEGLDAWQRKAKGYKYYFHSIKKLNFNFQLYANFVSSKGKLFSRETIYLPLTSKLVHYEYNTNQIENIWFEVCRINIFPYLQNISEMAVL